MRLINSLFMIPVILFIPAGCSDDRQVIEHEDHESVAVTRWTDKSELFMEYEELAAGRASEFVTHLTVLKDFSPITVGTVTYTFTGENGETVQEIAEAPVREGIYLPSITIGSPGTYNLTLTIDSPQLNDSIMVGEIHVHDETSEEHTHEGDAHTGSIAFLKEQQWKVGFMVEPVSQRTMTESIAAVGEIREMPGRAARVTVPVEGTVDFLSGGEFPIPGMWVEKGQILAVIVPLPETRSQVAETISAYHLAEAEYNRMQRLYKQQAVSKKRLEEARQQYISRKANHEVIPWILDNGEAQDAKTRISYQVTAPISGFIESLNINPGKTVRAGESICSILDPTRVQLTVHVPSGRIARVVDLLDAGFSLEGHDQIFSVSELAGNVLSKGNQVDTRTRTIPVTFEIGNPDNMFKVGMSADVSLMTAKRIDTMAVPSSAVITEYNNYIAYVQIGGESFEKRILATGITDGGYVQVLDGLAPGERIVTEGAYQVRLASMSSVVPTGHGHDH